MSDRENPIECLVVTGALGALGWKLLLHLAETGAISHIIGLDIRGITNDEKLELEKARSGSNATGQSVDIELLECDLRNWEDNRWQQAFEEADAVVHLAVQNVWPDAPWNDAMASFAMTVNAATVALNEDRIKRFVCASSNHAVGRYKDEPLAGTIAPRGLTTDLEPAPGTRWFNGKEHIDSYKYGSSKVAMETLCRAYADMGKGNTSFVCVRIGWCQHGINTPERIAISWDQERSGEEDLPDGWSKDLKWFKEMWLSDRDYCHLMERAVFSDASTWPGSFLIVNGVSDNGKMAWSLQEAQTYLQYQPKDSVYDAYAESRDE